MAQLAKEPHHESEELGLSPIPPHLTLSLSCRNKGIQNRPKISLKKKEGLGLQYLPELFHLFVCVGIQLLGHVLHPEQSSAVFRPGLFHAVHCEPCVRDGPVSERLHFLVEATQWTAKCHSACGKHNTTDKNYFRYIIYSKEFSNMAIFFFLELNFIFLRRHTFKMPLCMYAFLTNGRWLMAALVAALVEVLVKAY